MIYRSTDPTLWSIVPCDLLRSKPLLARGMERDEVEENAAKAEAEARILSIRKRRRTGGL